MDLSSLNENQKKAVVTTEGPVLVIAGAGTGKTSVLTKRIAYLIQEIGVPANHILAFTFTNKAAEEMLQRINKIVPNTFMQWIRTYHGTCLKILKEDIEKLNIGYDVNFSIIDEDDQLTLVKQIIKDHNFNTKVQGKKIRSIIGQIKLCDIDFSDHSFYELANMFEVPDSNDARVCTQIFDIYQKRLKAANQLDFSDLINYAHRLLTTNDEVRVKWQERFKYVLIDEFQDTNLKQFEIIKCLVGPHNNVFAVGDPNQTIYTWRGAYPQIFNDYVNNYKGTQIINLFMNYRSTANILKGANNLINHNNNDFKNELFPVNAYQSEVNVYIGDYHDDEANFVCSTILDFIKQGKSYSDIAILYRANYCSKSIEEKLIQNKIPYIIYGTVNFYQRKEIKDIISYLKMLYQPDDISAMRIINVPKRSIGIDTSNAISAWASAFKKSFITTLYEIDEVSTISDKTKTKIKSFLSEIETLRDKLSGVSLEKAIPTLIQEIKYIEYLQNTEVEIEDRKENIDALIKSVAEFKLDNPNATIIDFINEISLYTSAEKTRAKSDTPTVSLMTVHMAKGKEFDTVFVFNFNEGVLPSPNALLDRNGLEEERRIAYVAMTRAVNNLIITCTNDDSMSFAKYKAYTPSRFLKEIKDYKKAYRKFKTLSNTDLGWFDSRKRNTEGPSPDLSKIYTNNYEFKVGDVISHTVFGPGVVTAVNGKLIDVVFKKPYGKKTLCSSHNAIKRMLS